MNCAELLDILDRGEDSSHQFKENFASIDNLAVEISAFANTDGGMIIIGVSDSGKLIGLRKADIQRLNQWISNAVTNKIDKPIDVTTEILSCEGKRILVVRIPRGIDKPYAVNRTDVWIKKGADKRRASIEEVLRLAQSVGLVYADETPTSATLNDFDKEFFVRWYRENLNKDPEQIGIPFERLLKNMKLARDGQLTLAGLLLFGKTPQTFRPQFGIKATYFAGNSVTANQFLDKEDIHGKLFEQYKQANAFIRRNLRRVQQGEEFNAPGVLEIPEEAFSEIVANAIVHRNYYISAPIQIYLFDDRVEIHSPGNLPNTLDEENIKFGIHIERNPIILSLMEKDREFKYTGRGTGIPRVLDLCRSANIRVEFRDDKSRQLFSAVFYRKKPL
ncbi:MAG: transcriptional regulator [Methanobacteriota archaeon]|nr:MAG: transcriptional regulator [Euryarchaeota archaeon]